MNATTRVFRKAPRKGLPPEVDPNLADVALSYRGTSLTFSTPVSDYCVMVGRGGLTLAELFDELIFPLLEQAGYPANEITAYLVREWQPTNAKHTRLEQLASEALACLRAALPLDGDDIDQHDLISAAARSLETYYQEEANG